MPSSRDVPLSVSADLSNNKTEAAKRIDSRREGKYGLKLSVALVVLNLTPRLNRLRLRMNCHFKYGTQRNLRRSATIHV